MRKYRIAWLPGDGIGPEVCEAARLVLDAVEFPGEYVQGDIGWEFWKREGDALPRRTIELLRSTDCAFFGAVISKPAPEADRELGPKVCGRGFIYRSPVVRMRQLLDLYACLRPSKALPGNPLSFREGIDIVVFRENTEGMYTGVEFESVPESFYHEPAMAHIPADAAIGVRCVTRAGSRRIVKAAFDYAARCGRRKVTAVHKANVLRTTCGLFLDSAREIAAAYPRIEFEAAHIDTICMGLLKKPLHYDVIVTTNLFGDILSALCAQLVGGPGFAYGGNLGDSYAVFEPAHGPAPECAGRNRANPLAAILAARMMLEWLGEKRRAERIEAAVAEVVARGEVRTPDMGGDASTYQMARAVIQAANPEARGAAAAR